jgi:DNA-binding NarL/FixJ family response regulator
LRRVYVGAAMTTSPPAQGTAHSAWPAASVSLVVVAADQLASRRIAAALERFGLSVVGQVRSVDELLGDPDLRAVIAPGRAAVVLACAPSRPDGLTAIRRLTGELRGVGLVVMAPGSDAGGVRQALNAGAHGVVSELELEVTLGPATLAVVAGHLSVPRRLHRSVFRPAFSHREKQVLALVLGGASNGQIAARLFLAESTVKSHLGSACRKLGVHSRKEAAAVLLDPDEGLAGCLNGIEPG